MRFDVVPEHPDEVELAKAIYLDWLLYGEIHVTNANGVSRLDPRGITYAPQNSEVSVSELVSHDPTDAPDRAQNA